MCWVLGAEILKIGARQQMFTGTFNMRTSTKFFLSECCDHFVA
jgi:hypothetical protein